MSLTAGCVRHGEARSLTAFGLRIESDFCLPGGALRAGGRHEPELMLRSASRGDLEGLAAEPRYLRYLHSYEGCGYAMLESGDGDVLFHYRHRALFHLSADHRVLRCAISERGSAWQRVLLDTVLWSVSLLKGFELLHASAAVTPLGLIALVGRSGAGKTTLVSELLKRGAVLFADDIVALEARDADIVAHPGPPFMNVPRSLDPRCLGTGEVLADLGAERWISIDRVPPSPRRIQVIVLLREGSATKCVAVAPTSLPLLPHLITFPHLVNRRRQQFETAGAVAAGASIISLSYPRGADPAALVELISERLENAAAGAATG